jgi:hypothetical protein
MYLMCVSVESLNKIRAKLKTTFILFMNHHSTSIRDYFLKNQVNKDENLLYVSWRDGGITIRRQYTAFIGIRIPTQSSAILF